jgi:TonB family protein
VSPEGVPENITVTGADPRDLFEEAAIAAVAQWRYAPRQAAAETDNRIHFKPPDAAPALAVTSDPPKG